MPILLSKREEVLCYDDRLYLLSLGWGGGWAFDLIYPFGEYNIRMGALSNLKDIRFFSDSYLSLACDSFFSCQLCIF